MVTLTIRSTHYYLVALHKGFFMVDAGWAGTLPALKAELKRQGLDLSDIRYLMITHHHPDHAGLAQEIKQASGARLVILEHQVPFLKQLHSLYAGKKETYIPIRIDPGDLVLSSANREDLAKIGLQGEIVATPGHSDDSVSLVLDSGEAFTGDLHLPEYEPEGSRQLTCQSWKRLVLLGAKMVYPAHGSSFPIVFLEQSLRSACEPGA